MKNFTPLNNQLNDTFFEKKKCTWKFITINVHANRCLKLKALYVRSIRHVVFVSVKYSRIQHTVTPQYDVVHLFVSRLELEIHFIYVKIILFSPDKLDNGFDSSNEPRYFVGHLVCRKASIGIVAPLVPSCSTPIKILVRLKDGRTILRFSKFGKGRWWHLPCLEVTVVLWRYRK